MVLSLGFDGEGTPPTIRSSAHICIPWYSSAPSSNSGGICYVGARFREASFLEVSEDSHNVDVEPHFETFSITYIRRYEVDFLRESVPGRNLILTMAHAAETKGTNHDSCQFQMISANNTMIAAAANLQVH